MTSIARTRAEEKFELAQRQAKQVQKEREKAEQAFSDKTARLRALRLAKEAADKQTAASQPAEKPAKRR